jgi:hypothetical protein
MRSAVFHFLQDKGGNAEVPQRRRIGADVPCHRRLGAQVMTNVRAELGEGQFRWRETIGAER